MTEELQTQPPFAVLPHRAAPVPLASFPGAHSGFWELPREEKKHLGQARACRLFNSRAKRVRLLVGGSFHPRRWQRCALTSSWVHLCGLSCPSVASAAPERDSTCMEAELKESCAFLC